jgi:hypothetical protein
MPINENHREHLEFTRALSKDSEGREVLIGLTFDETEWFLQYLDNRYDEKPTGSNSADDSDLYLLLHERHEAARLEMVMAEIEARHTPTRN